MNDIYPWQQSLWQKLAHNRRFWGHALLLKGKQGIGKYDFVRHLAQSLLCSEPTAEQHACNQCASCGWFAQHGHPNFYAVLPEALNTAAEGGGKVDGNEPSEGITKKNASQQISIDQIRKLNDFVYLTGHQAGYKIVLIYPAETMNAAAANALLKKLEEPPAQVLFMLVTHQAQRLLPTIRSRCQHIAMPMPDMAASLAWLAQQGVSDPRASLAAAGFSPLLALRFNEEQHAARYRQFVQLIGHSGRFDPVSMATQMLQTDLSLTVTWLQQWCYDLISYRGTGKIRYFQNQSTIIKAVGARMDVHACLAYARVLNARQQLSQHPLNPRLFLEELFIDYAAMIGRT